MGRTGSGAEAELPGEALTRRNDPRRDLGEQAVLAQPELGTGDRDRRHHAAVGVVDRSGGAAQALLALLEIEGEDRVGFLAALLRRMAYLSLFPVELELETSGGRALDRFWLRSAGDRAPSERARVALAASLEALVHSGPGRPKGAAAP